MIFFMFWSRQFWLATTTRSRLTWKARFFLLTLLALIAFLSRHAVYQWLAVTQTQPTPAPWVIEGWVSDSLVKEAATNWQEKRTPFLITTGGPLGRGDYLLPWHNYARLAAATASSLGVPDEAIYAVPSLAAKKDRTEASAASLREWLKEHPTIIPERRFVLVTEAAHARRSWMTFRRVFGAEWTIEIMALPPENYDATRWWATSAGLKDVIGEAFACVYEVCRRWR
jgi:uncharacterized SAM-binding protein YcdF (DUF218 family)